MSKGTQGAEGQNFAVPDTVRPPKPLPPRSEARIRCGLGSRRNEAWCAFSGRRNAIDNARTPPPSDSFALRAGFSVNEILIKNRTKNCPPADASRPFYALPRPAPRKSHPVRINDRRPNAWQTVSTPIGVSDCLRRIEFIRPVVATENLSSMCTRDRLRPGGRLPGTTAMLVNVFV